MFLTKERDYAMRVVRSLCNMEKQTVKAISEKEYIPLDFAYKILKKLEHSGITSSTRGKNGGYRLSKSPDTISMLDVLLAMDRRLFVNDETDEQSQRSNTYCRIREEFGVLQGIWVKTLQDKTLDMLA